MENYAKIGFFMVVSAREGGLALDAVHTILRCYPGARIWLRDDCTQDGTWEQLESVARVHADRVDLVRNPVPMGFKGIPVSVFRSFAHICKSGVELDMLIRVDPDVLLTGQDIVAFAQQKFAAEGPGIIGSYRLSASKARRSNTTFCLRFLLDLFPLGFDRQHRRIRFGMPFYTRFLVKSFRNGYLLGRHVLASFYIVHGDTLRALARAGFWTSIPEMGSREMKWDDALVSIGPWYVGHKLIDLHQLVDSKFWIQLKNPLPLSAEEIVAAHYQAVHPLKNDAAGTALRARLAGLTT